MSLPWYRWYAGDWLGSPTRLDMSAAERGVYRDLLDWHYIEGSIPADETKLRRRLAVTDQEFAATWPAVSRKFEPDPDNPDRLINRRAVNVMAETAKFSRKQTENGKKGGRPKANGSPKLKPSGHAEPEPKTNPSLSLSEPDTETHKQQTCPPDGGRACASPNGCALGFADWYGSYPRKVARRKAEKAYRQLTATRREVLAANTPAWLEEFASRPTDKIPYPASFINSEAWEERPPQRIGPQAVRSGAAEILEALRA